MTTGHIRKRGAGWQLIVSGGFDARTGKRVQRSGTVHGSKKDAEAALAVLVVKVAQGELVDVRATFGELLTAWLTRATPDLSPSTVRTTGFFIRYYIEPTLGRLALRKVTPAKLDKLYSDLRAGGGKDGRPLAPRTVRRVHNIVHGALQQALRWGWVSSNAAARSSPPKLGQSEVTAPSPVDVGRVLDAAQAEDPDFAMFLRLSAVTGARRGELCGLRWDAVDLDGSALLIRRGIVLGPGGVVMDKDTKTHASRRLALDVGTVELLRAHRARWQQRVELCARPWREDQFVFSYDGAAAKPIVPDRVTKRFRHLSDSLDLPDVRLHDLRHFVATRLIAAGVPVRTVSGRLGHAAASTTLNTYSHFVQATDQHAADLLGMLLDGKKSRPPETEPD